MEKGSYQTCVEEVLREEESEDIDYCIEDLNVREERKEDFLENMKDSVIIDDAIVQGVCIVNGLYEEIINDVIEQATSKDRFSIDVKDYKKSKKENRRKSIFSAMKEAKVTNTLVCNAIFHKGPSTPNVKRNRIPLEVKTENKYKATKENVEPFDDVMKNIQSKCQEKMKEKLHKNEKDLIQMDRKLNDAEELIRIKGEECDLQEKEASALKRTVQLLEKDLDSSNNRLEISNQSLAAMTEKADESYRRCQVLESKLEMEENKAFSLELQLVSVRNVSEDSEKKCNEVSRSLAILELEFSKLQSDAGESNRTVKSQEDEIKQLKEALKSSEVAVNRAETKVDALTDKVKSADEKSAAREETAEQKRREIQALNRQLQSTEKQLQEKTMAFKNFQEDLEKQIEELMRM